MGIEELEELLELLRIDKEAIENENGSYTIDLDDSNEYIRYYSRIKNSGLFEEDTEANQTSSEVTTAQFISTDEFNFKNNSSWTITVLANWDTDEYKLVIRDMTDYNI